MTGLCFVCFDSKLFYSFEFLSISQLLYVCQFVCLSVCLSIHLPTYFYLSKGEMKEILLDAQELVARWQQADPPKKQMWADRQTLLNESWAQSRAESLKFFLQSAFAVPEDAMCERCLNEVAVVKCHECSASQHFCCGCDNIIHGSLCAYPSNNITKQLISFLSFTYSPICSCIFVSPQSNSLSF